MTDKEQIEEMARELCGKSKFINGEYVCGMLNFKCNCHCNYGSYAESSINAGYHRTIWHKVADGDLPDIGKEVLCYDGENYIVCKWDNIDWYDTNEICYNVIAWTELPTYKE